MLKFILNYTPPSVNTLYRFNSHTKRVFPTFRYNQFKTIAKEDILKQIDENFILINKGMIHLDIELFLNTQKKRDIDNCLKALIDLGNNLIWDDDNRIHSINIKKINSQIEKTIMNVKITMED